ncbi:hypothetical protein SAMN04488109_1750 [Chryseolinea serpens]|uniref:Uncharacterized protein n=1 Tax=Chryseolinea serpens TaxID=947013 RepID=A0A1M5MHJ4_9BACT|nr:hypothetical protein [Chryseolinea serpens]SHG76815.1 hypothetical protein SAMN04488109_1750 [Chryseolinea serpens]
MKAKLVLQLAIKITFLVFLFASIGSFAQETYTENVRFVHTGASSSNPKFYNQTVFPKNGYYAISVDYSPDGQSGCGWCYPNDRNQGTPKINNYGESVTLSTKCDGLPCNFYYAITFKKYFFDETLIKITKDNEENLSSNIWAENTGGKEIELIYKVETYDPGSAKYTSRTSSVKIPGFSKTRLIPRYKRIDNTLREDFLTALYTK